MKAIPTKFFRKFLKSAGCHKDRNEGGHEIWDREGLLRPIVFRANEKEIPLLHIHTNLQDLGVSHKDFEKAIEEL